MGNDKLSILCVSVISGFCLFFNKRWECRQRLVQFNSCLFILELSLSFCSLGRRPIGVPRDVSFNLPGRCRQGLTQKGAAAEPVEDSGRKGKSPHVFKTRWRPRLIIFSILSFAPCS